MLCNHFQRGQWLACALAALVLLGCTQQQTLPGQPLSPVKSAADDRDYRYLRLDNGLRVLLVSDPDTPKAAASLDVYVGSASNPEDRGGLAHFLEHMLFLGTDKYPDSGEYARFISENGGSRNAYTGFEHTNYFFDVSPAQLGEALDRFGQFFIAPRFDAKYVEREVNAVHAEYQLGLKTDARRTLDVIREVVNPAHPYAVLGVGTRETLADRPGAPVREDLINFYETYYSANLMSLVVVGREPLDELQTKVTGIFEQVPNRGTRVPDIQAPLYAPGSLPMVVHIQPLATQRALELSFPIPNYSKRYRAKPLNYISNLVGHEGEGSLLSLLKEEGWAEGLRAGEGITYRGGAAFSVSISLTEAGLANRDKVLEKFFQYIEMLRRAGPRRSIYEEQARLAELAFRFKPEVSAMGYATSLANDLHLYQPEDVLRGNYLMEDYSPELIEGLLDQYISAENVLVSVIAEGVPVDRESEFYATPYSVESLGPDRQGWRLAAAGELDSRLYLPAPNEFIAEDVTLEPISADNPEVPQLVKDTGRLRAWFRQDGQFREPRGALYASFRNAMTNDTAANAATARLYVALLQDSVNEFTYPAWLAGLNFSVFAHGRGISLKISGYDDKQLHLLERIVESVATADLDTHRFDNIRDNLVRGLENTKTARAFRQVVGDARELLLSGQWDEQALIDELQRLTPADVQVFAHLFWNTAEVDVMLNGNYPPEAVGAALDRLAPLLQMTLDAQPPQGRIVRLEPGEHLVFEADVEHADSVYFLYLQGRDDSLRERGMTALTAQVVDADFFEELRTQQQLGYVVSAFNWTQLEVPALAFLVQSPAASLPELQQATTAFLESRAEPGRVTEALFQRHRNAVVQELLKPHTNIVEASEYYWQEIARRNLAFDSRESLAAAVNRIGYDEWKQWYSAVVLENPASLAVVAPGRWEALPVGDVVASPLQLRRTHDEYIRP